MNKRLLPTIIIFVCVITSAMCESRYINSEVGFSFDIPDCFIIDNGSMTNQEKLGKYIFKVVVYDPYDKLNPHAVPGHLNEFREYLVAKSGIPRRFNEPVIYVEKYSINCVLSNINWACIGGYGFERLFQFIKKDKIITIFVVYKTFLRGEAELNNNIYKYTADIHELYYRKYRSQGHSENIASMLAYQEMEANIRNGNPDNLPQEYVDLILKFDEIVNSLEFFDP